MATVPASFIFTLVGCIVVLTSNGVVDAKVIINSRRQYGELNCLQRVSMCMMPLYGIDPESLNQQLLTVGLRPTCQPFLQIEQCVNAQLRGCEDEIPDQMAQVLVMMSDLIGFVCRTEIDSIEADLECMAGEKLDSAIEENCETGLQPSGNICSLADDSECAFQQYETVCNNKPLADKFRSFMLKIQNDADCTRVAAKSINWRSLMKMLKR